MITYGRTLSLEIFSNILLPGTGVNYPTGSGLDNELVISHQETMLRRIFNVLSSKKMIPVSNLQ